MCNSSFILNRSPIYEIKNCTHVHISIQISNDIGKYSSEYVATISMNFQLDCKSESHLLNQK